MVKIEGKLYPLQNDNLVNHAEGNPYVLDMGKPNENRVKNKNMGDDSEFGSSIKQIDKLGPQGQDKLSPGVSDPQLIALQSKEVERGKNSDNLVKQEDKKSNKHAASTKKRIKIKLIQQEEDET